MKCLTSTKIMVMSFPAGSLAKDVHSKSKGVASLRSPEAASLPQLLQLAPAPHPRGLGVLWAQHRADAGDSAARGDGCGNAGGVATLLHFFGH